MNRRLNSLVERTVNRIAIDSQANRWVNLPRSRRMRGAKMGGEGWLERCTPCAAGPRGGSAASQKEEARRERSEEGGRSR
jgi:hypothetical protein